MIVFPHNLWGKTIFLFLFYFNTTNLSNSVDKVSYGLHDLLRNNAANIHSAEDWSVVFSLLEVQNTFFYNGFRKNIKFLFIMFF